MAAKTITYRSHIQAIAQAADEIVFTVADHQGLFGVEVFFGVDHCEMSGAFFVYIIKRSNCMTFK